jgi:hypothetical protein
MILLQKWATMYNMKIGIGNLDIMLGFHFRMVIMRLPAQIGAEINGWVEKPYFAIILIVAIVESMGVQIIIHPEDF